MCFKFLRNFAWNCHGSWSGTHCSSLPILSSPSPSYPLHGAIWNPCITVNKLLDIPDSSAHPSLEPGSLWGGAWVTRICALDPARVVPPSSLSSCMNPPTPCNLSYPCAWHGVDNFTDDSHYFVFMETESLLIHSQREKCVCRVSSIHTTPICWRHRHLRLHVYPCQVQRHLPFPCSRW